MVDEQQADPDKSVKTTAPAQAAPQGDDWGADWESAFQAEEFPADEAEGASALAEAGQDSAHDFTPAEEDDSRAELPSGAREAETATAVGVSAQPAARAAGPGLAARLMTRFTALPLPVRLGIPCTLLMLLISVTLFRLLKHSAQPPAPTTPTEQAAAPPAPLVAPPSPPLQEDSPAMAVAPSPEPAPADTAPPQAEKTTVTWPFTAFIIPVVDNDTKTTLFVTVELALVLAQDNETQGLPLTQKPFLRDTIYQFFVNRPLYDLRRYAMANGEMHDQLIEWLRKQWPEGEIASLTINSYKID